MNPLLLYLLFCKATFSSFTGFTSLAMVRQDLVVTHHLLTDQQLAIAAAAGRLSPGPNGLYLVGIGYYAAGYPGAFAGWLALATPAFLSIALYRFLRDRADHPALRAAIDGVLPAAAGLSLANAIPLGAGLWSQAVPVALMLASLVLYLRGTVHPLAVIIGASAISVLAHLA